MITLFDVNDKVKLKSTGRAGVIKSCKYEKTNKDGVIIESMRYFVRFNAYTFFWHLEEEIKEDHTYEFEDKFELNLLDFLIDIYLKNRKFDLVKKLHKARLHLRGEK